MVTGIRGDYHNYYGFFVTPRIHTRFAISELTVLRASAGRGQRTANILAENNGLFASSRQIQIEGDGSDRPYGLDPEVAWNYGVNLTQYFELDYRNGTLSFDFYRTDFQNQIVVDLDQSPQAAVFYNLDGESYSNSFQVQLDYELIKRLDARIAYRWFDVWTTYDDVLRRKPLIAQNRAFMNLAYESRNHWKYDLTVNWQGEKRIPDTQSNPEGFQLDQQSPDFVLINAQISKAWNEGKFEVYMGVENLLNYAQDIPILAADQPFGSFFDSSMVWGPIFGRNTYMGLRYRLK
jgi:outer membrane receptor for ferrienterochelin and colicin